MLAGNLASTVPPRFGLAHLPRPRTADAVAGEGEPSTWLARLQGPSFAVVDPVPRADPSVFGFGHTLPIVVP
jgi:hypothetical protein